MNKHISKLTHCTSPSKFECGLAEAINSTYTYRIIDEGSLTAHIVCLYTWLSRLKAGAVRRTFFLCHLHNFLPANAMRDLPQFEERERDKVRAAYDSFLVYDNRPSNYQASVEQGNQGFVDMSDVLGVLFFTLVTICKTVPVDSYQTAIHSLFQILRGTEERTWYGC